MKERKTKKIVKKNAGKVQKKSLNSSNKQNKKKKKEVIVEKPIEYRCERHGNIQNHCIDMQVANKDNPHYMYGRFCGKCFFEMIARNCCLPVVVEQV